MPSPAELKEQGLNLYRAEKYAEAVEKFAAAAQAFAAAGDQASAAEMRNNQCVTHLAEKQWEAALAAVDGTPEIFHALGNKLREAQALANLAASHEGLGRSVEAAEFYLQAIELFGELGEKENRAACFKALSGLQLKAGQQLQALASMHSGLNLAADLSAKEKTLKAMLDRALKMMQK